MNIVKDWKCGKKKNLKSGDVMFVQLPRIYEDELFFSIASRYHYCSLNISLKKTLMDLGISKATPLIPCNLRSFLREINTYNPPKYEDFLRSHTLYFFYSNFISEKEKIELCDLLEGNKTRVNKKLN
jgi:hypothetical protein